MDHQIDVVAQGLRDRAGSIVDGELHRMRREAPAFFVSDDPDFVAAYTSSCVAHLGVLLDQLTAGRDIPASLPPAAIEETRTVAQWGISLEALIQTYRTAHAVIWEYTMEVVEEVIETPVDRAQALRLISRFLFAYTDRMVALLADVYESERMSLFHDRDRRRRQLVRDVLEGLPIDQTKLPYLVSGVHLAAVATGEGADRALTQIAAKVGVTALTVPGPSGSVWAWMGGSTLRSKELQERIISLVPPTALVGFGDVAEGEEGFRISHREARQAYRIGRRRSSHVVQYGDVALLSLTTMDESLARQFMDRELGFLADGEDSRSEDLRTTLRAYFDTGHNASAAAARLQLNDRTVAYRLRTIETKLGRPILSRRDELSVALRLFDMFNALASAEEL